MNLGLEDFFLGIDTFLGRVPNTVNYVAVGCAPNLTEKGRLKLRRSEYHELPQFLVNIIEQFGVRLNLILIDPNSDKTPYCVKNNLYDVDGWDSWSIYEDYPNIFHNDYATVFSFKRYVRYFGEYGIGSEDKSVNITEMLKSLNMHCLENGQLLFVHDFTGRDFSKVAYMFDRDLGNSRNRIMYDINFRRNDGCFIDLADDVNMPIVYLNDTQLYIKNPFLIKNSKDVQKFITDDISKLHCLCYLNHRLAMYKNIYSAFRMFYVARTSQGNAFQYVNQETFSYFMSIHRLDIYRKLVPAIHSNYENAVTGVVECLRDVALKTELVSLLKLFYADDNEAERKADEFNSTFEEADPYRWVNSVVSFVENAIDRLI